MPQSAVSFQVYPPPRLRQAKSRRFPGDRRVRAVPNAEPIGVMGEVRPEVLEAYSLEPPASALELSLAKLLEQPKCRRLG